MFCEEALIAILWTAFSRIFVYINIRALEVSDSVSSGMKSRCFLSRIIKITAPFRAKVGEFTPF